MMSTKSVGRVGGFVLAVMVGGLAMVMTPMAMAQQAGTVTGHVTCGDTQRPARFAGVVLLGVPKEAGVVTPPVTSAKGGLNFSIDKIDVVQTETELDGSYSVSGVAPGDYYVFASVPGYVQPSALVQAAIDAGGDPKKQLQGIPVVHVGGEGGSSMDITVQRGGAISGHVMWDDGSPAAKVIMTAVSTKATGKSAGTEFGMLGIGEGLNGGGTTATTDDLGQYRIAGLAPGEYLVRGMLQLRTGFSMQHGVPNFVGMGVNTPLLVYAPASFHKADAKAVTLHAGDEITGADVTIRLTGMHSVSGKLLSAEDGHGLNGGEVTLTDTSDKDMTRGTGVDANGNFMVEFVPPGTYKLTVSEAADTEPAKKAPAGQAVFFTMPDVVRRYEGGAQSVVVGDTDVVGLDIVLQPVKGQKAGAN